MSSPTQHKTMRRAMLQKHNEFELRAFMSVSLESNLSSHQRCSSDCCRRAEEQSSLRRANALHHGCVDLSGGRLPQYFHGDDQPKKVLLSANNPDRKSTRLNSSHRCIS